MNKTTKKERNSIVWRWMFLGSNILNFGTLQGTAYAMSMSKALRAVYPNNEDYVKAMDVEYEYFNTTPYVAPVILGADLAMQEEEGIDSLDAVRSIKTSLMGPLAGVGDSLLWVLYPTIMGSIAGYMALEGNPIGAIIWILLNALLIPLRFKMFDIGYSQGTRLITDLSHHLTAFTESASVMGLTVVGSLIATVIKLTLTTEFHFGEITMNVQEEIFDAFLPKLLPLLLVIIVYWLMEKKRWGFVQIIFLLIGFSLLGAYFGFLG